MRFARFAAAAAAALLLAAPLAAQTGDPLKVIVFPGTGAWTFYVGVEKGLFARAGAPVEIHNTPSSVFQLTNLHAGKFDIGITLMDNVIAYKEGQGEVKLDPPPDFFAFLAVNNNHIVLVTVPEVKSFADLKGRELSVDALTTGNSFTLMEMLRRGGLAPGDYKLVSVGGTPQRAQALEEKKQAGTVLSPPFDLALIAKGFNQLSGSTEAVGRFEGIVASARRSWASANQARVVGFTRATAESVDWLLDKANRDEAVAILRKYLPQTPAAAAERSFDLMADPVRGLKRPIAIDLEAVRNVMAVRARYAEPRKELTDPARYIDASYFQRAMMRN